MEREIEEDKVFLINVQTLIIEKIEEISGVKVILEKLVKLVG